MGRWLCLPICISSSFDATGRGFLLTVSLLRVLFFLLRSSLRVAPQEEDVPVVCRGHARTSWSIGMSVCACMRACVGVFMCHTHSLSHTHTATYTHIYTPVPLRAFPATVVAARRVPHRQKRQQSTAQAGKEGGEGERKVQGQNVHSIFSVLRERLLFLCVVLCFVWFGGGGLVCGCLLMRRVVVFVVACGGVG